MGRWSAGRYEQGGQGRQREGDLLLPVEQGDGFAVARHIESVVASAASEPILREGRGCGEGSTGGALGGSLRVGGVAVCDGTKSSVWGRESDGSGR